MASTDLGADTAGEKRRCAASQWTRIGTGKRREEGEPPGLSSTPRRKSSLWREHILLSLTGKRHKELLHRKLNLKVGTVFGKNAAVVVRPRSLGFSDRGAFLGSLSVGLLLVHLMTFLRRSNQENKCSVCGHRSCQASFRLKRVDGTEPLDQILATICSELGAGSRQPPTLSGNRCRRMRIWR